MAKTSLKNLIRALRLPFITASALPFIFGSLAAQNEFKLLNFALGLIAVIAAHLSANPINDYAQKEKLFVSSELTIAIQTLVGIVLIIGVIL